MMHGVSFETSNFTNLEIKRKLFTIEDIIVSKQTGFKFVHGQA